MENVNCNWHLEINREAYGELESEIYDLRQLALKLKLLDEYRGNTDDELAIAAISFDIDELFNMAEGIAILYNQLAERVVDDSHNTP